MANSYDVGQLVRCYGAFLDTNDDNIDPTNVYFKFEDPSANETAYTYGVHAELVKDTTGDYHADIDVDEAGTWYYRFYSTGIGQAAAETNFIAKATEF